MSDVITSVPSAATQAGPQPFNVTAYLVDRNLAAGRGGRIALRHPGGSLSYAEVDAQVTRIARGLAGLGVRPEERVLFCMADGPELACAILAAMRIGAVAVPCSTMLTGRELGTLVADSRARTVIGSDRFAEATLTAAAGAPDVRAVVLTGEKPQRGGPARTSSWAEMLAAGTDPEPFTTWTESPALWLYTSGTTGKPKGAMHRHADIRIVCETYGHQVLGIQPDDVVLSVAKLFFAYGIGNSLFFPFSVGACAVLEPARPTPARIAELVAGHGVTVLYAVPSFWSPLLAAAELPDAALATVRRAVSAGEALPARVYHGIRQRFGVEVLDGIGSTEALHIFISNRPGAVVPGSSGFPVPGYRVQLRRSDGSVIDGAGEPGMLYIAGDSLCTGYWCRAEVNRLVFDGEWMRTGDRYVRNADDSLTCLGRTDDVLKVGGMWVSPTEVESRLLEHPELAEAAVVGVADSDGLDKPVAFVVPTPGGAVDPEEVIRFCRDGLAAFKRPREVRVVDELPKTATGKVQRYRLRELAAAPLTAPA